jgi:type III secretory pathway component EscT
VNIGLGVVSRAAPQLNIFAVGFPLTMMMGFHADVGEPAAGDDQLRRSW